MLKFSCLFPLNKHISYYSLENVFKSFLAGLLLKKISALTHMLLGQNKICGKKLLTLTDVQLPINFLKHDVLLDTW